MSKKPVICLMGPTASGKTDVALRLAEEFPLDVISVDSALVYRGMDIGTAKPDAETLRRVPHRLIDIRDPEDSYSAGEFVRDARAEIDASHARGHVPLLVGGTMMYFRALTEGIADLPEAAPKIRAAIDAEAAASGWPALHTQLAAVDANAAARIKPNDSQRIQRALEVYRVSGRSLSEWQADAESSDRQDIFLKIALHTASRPVLHDRIAVRLQRMMENGFVEEVQTLMARPGLTAGHSSMRAVGYRQIWSHLEGQGGLEDATNKALAATRQLAKRQLTWLRSEQQVTPIDALETDAPATISALVRGQLEL
jgi:tRNA dimethylallyltransferase